MADHRDQSAANERTEDRSSNEPLMINVLSARKSVRDITGRNMTAGLSSIA
jgi:hypothetical protein